MSQVICRKRSCPSSEFLEIILPVASNVLKNLACRTLFVVKDLARCANFSKKSCPSRQIFVTVFCLSRLICLKRSCPSCEFFKNNLARRIRFLLKNLVCRALFVVNDLVRRANLLEIILPVASNCFRESCLPDLICRKKFCL